VSELGLSVTNTAEYTSSVNMSGLYSGIPVAKSPNVMFYGVTEWRKTNFINTGKLKTVRLFPDDFRAKN